MQCTLNKSLKCHFFNKVEESGTQCKPINIIIAGAGLSGVEIAAQMASFSTEFYSRNNFICRKLNIVMINSGKTILKGIDEHLVQKSQKRLLELKIIIKHERKVVELTNKKNVTLSDGEILPMDFMIFAGGVEPNGLIYKLDLVKK